MLVVYLYILKKRAIKLTESTAQTSLNTLYHCTVQYQGVADYHINPNMRKLLITIQDAIDMNEVMYHCDHRKKLNIQVPNILKK